MGLGKKTGVIKFWSERLRGYMSWAQSGMIAYLFFKEVGFSWWYILGALIISIVIFYIDKRWIYPNESAEATKRNSEWIRFMNELQNFMKNR